MKNIIITISSYLQNLFLILNKVHIPGTLVTSFMLWSLGNEIFIFDLKKGFVHVLSTLTYNYTITHYIALL